MKRIKTLNSASLKKTAHARAAAANARHLANQLARHLVQLPTKNARTIINRI